MVIRLIIILGLLIIQSCAPPLMVPAISDAQNGSSEFSDLTYDDLARGHRLYINKCGNCHFLYRPYQFGISKWNKELPEMKTKAKLSENEYDLIIKYVKTMNGKVPGK